MMVSLRARLVAGVLALSAVGLLLLGGITYVEQRNFLLDRLDQQVRAAPGAVAHELGEAAEHGPRGHDHDMGGGPPPGGGPPLGTYGQLRDASGNVLDDTSLGYTTVTSPPRLPAHLPANRIVTVSSGGARYRVLSTPSPDGSVSIVVAVPLREVDQILHRLLLVEALVIGGILLLLGLVAWAVVRIGLLPLDRMGHTAGAIAGGDLSRRVETSDPRTEVGRLGIALNAMLDRLEQAFAERETSQERLRRFIADASHELRTPLASIRGYAEVFRLGAAADPEETERAMRRIEQEAARMGVLVEDLLTLARLDEVRETPHVDVDLAALARDAVDDARARAPDRDIEARAEAPAVVSGDAHQLRQVLSNLLGNALVHTPRAASIEVSVEREGRDVSLEVRDHGPGLPPGDPEALFERFWRAEGGRERGKGGAGLGLAIVAGIVDAHGGRVEARNAPGGGASFVVRLPSATSQGSPSPLRREGSIFGA